MFDYLEREAKNTNMFNLFIIALQYLDSDTALIILQMIHVR